MIVLYPSISLWEFSYIKNEFLNNFENINYYYYDNYLITQSLELLIKNNTNNKIIFIFSTNSIKTNIDYINLIKLIDFLKPKTIISLSDEYGINSDTIFSDKTNLFLYSYHHNNYIFSNKDYQIPLGYVTNYLEDKNFTEIQNTLKKIIDRKYNCSFIGQLKNDRVEMINTFKENMSKCNIIEVLNSWNLNEQVVKPNELFSIYNNSIFVLIGRGNKSLNCFRVYEAISAGAIPLIVGNTNEIKSTFKFNEDAPDLLYDESWELLVNKCNKLLEKKEELQKIQENNISWWNRKINFINNLIKESLLK